MVQYRCQLITRGLCIAILLFLCSVRSGYGQDSSQNPTLQQLKDKLQNIEREMNDVQDQIKALEGAKTAPAPANQLPEGNAEQHAAEATVEPVKAGLGTMQFYGFTQLDAAITSARSTPLV